MVQISVHQTPTVQLTVQGLTKTNIGQALGFVPMQYTAGDNVTISESGVISAVGGSGGANVTLADNTAGGVSLTVSEETRVLAKHDDLTAQKQLSDSRWGSIQNLFTDTKTDSSSAYQKTVPENVSLAYLTELGGKTIRFNQIINLGYNWYGISFTFCGLDFNRNDDGSYTLNGTLTNDYSIATHVPSNSVPWVPGHTYLICGLPEGASSDTIYFYDNANSTVYHNQIFDCPANQYNTTGHNIYLVIKSGFTANQTKISPMLFDLTDMFGAGNKPETVAAFRERFPNDYYPYSPGGIRSAAVDKILWGETETVIPAAIQALPGYGLGISDTVRNYIDFNRKVFVRKCAASDGQLSELESPVETDISAYLTDAFQAVTVTPGEIITFHHPEADNGLQISVPSVVKYRMNSGVSDVKVNGTSIVQDGVANIPIAQNENYGISKTRTTYGTNSYNGFIMTNPAKNNEINYRHSYPNAAPYYCPIVPSNLDYAVKTAMCDGKGAAWTDDEKVASRERQGIVTLTQEEYDLIESPNESTIYLATANDKISNIYLGGQVYASEKWQKLVDVTLTESISPTYELSKSCSKIKIFIKTPSNPTITGPCYFLNQKLEKIAYVQSGALFTTVEKCMLGNIEIIDNTAFFDMGVGSNTLAGGNNAQNRSMCEVSATEITSIKIDKQLDVGTQIKIFGA